MTRVSSFLPLAVALPLITALTIFAGSASAQSNARLRVLHASPDAPAVDVYLDDQEAISGLAFESITDYVSVPAGAHNVKVYAASANGTGTPVIAADVTLAAGTDYTVAAVGELDEIAPLVLTDNNSAPATGQARLRVVHASPDAPNVDIFAQGAGVVVPNLPFKQASGYLDLPATSYNLEVRAAGATSAVLSLPGVALAPGKTYTAFAVGLAGGTPALKVKLTNDATAVQAAAATAAPTAHSLPQTGGQPMSDGSVASVWVLVALALASSGLTVGTLAAARSRSS